MRTDITHIGLFGKEEHTYLYYLFIIILLLETNNKHRNPINFIYMSSAYRWFYILLYIYYLQQNLNYLCLCFCYYFFNLFYWPLCNKVILLGIPNTFALPVFSFFQLGCLFKFSFLAIKIDPNKYLILIRWEVYSSPLIEYKVVNFI
jgi:hypothetical protein